MKCDQARRATYIFKKNPQGEWLCAIDNSYGTDLINNKKDDSEFPNRLLICFIL